MFDGVFYQKTENDKVRCLICPHLCLLSDGAEGICKARRNTKGKIIAQSYGQMSALNLDPVEKKPLHKFKQGSNILSFGSFGCNFSCSFCQNWHISMQRPETKYISPDDLVSFAEKAKDAGNIGLAFTYNEPLVNFEFVKDTSLLLRERGMDSVIVSNGYINEKPLLELAPLISAANIDIKSFNEKFYEKICGGKLEPVKNTVKILLQHCHVEITVLVIPKLNDSTEEINAIAKWLAGFDKNTVLHINRYFPCHKMDMPPTDKEVLRKLKNEALNFLRNVNIGNV